MRRLLPSSVRSILLLFTLMLFLLPAATNAQQQNLKTQADDPAQKVTGHNNLRKLSKIADARTRSADDKAKPVADDAQLRRLYEFEMLKDPANPCHLSL